MTLEEAIEYIRKKFTKQFLIQLFNSSICNSFGAGALPFFIDFKVIPISSGEAGSSHKTEFFKITCLILSDRKGFVHNLITRFC